MKYKRLVYCFGSMCSSISLTFVMYLYTLFAWLTPLWPELLFLIAWQVVWGWLATTLARLTINRVYNNLTLPQDQTNIVMQRHVATVIYTCIAYMLSCNIISDTKHISHSDAFQWLKIIMSRWNLSYYCFLFLLLS